MTNTRCIKDYPVELVNNINKQSILSMSLQLSLLRQAWNGLFHNFDPVSIIWSNAYPEGEATDGVF